MQKKFKPSFIKKSWYKLTDAGKHNTYKQVISHYKLTTKLEKFVSDGLDTTISEILEKSNGKTCINVLHEGNAGDIIYSLPIIKKLHELSSKPVNLILKLNEPLKIGNGFEHPLGNVMLNEKMADALIPLFKAQDYITDAETLQHHEIHLDLTLFRKAGFALDKGSIARWSFFTTGITPNLGEAWLNVTPNTNYANTVVLARSSRYNNMLIDYSFLSVNKELVFVGVKTEYDEMKKVIPSLRWHQVNDFLELAEIIAGCKLFIGNQSFPYAIAEGLKVKRLLEVFYQIPNVLPEGENGYDFCFQKHFEWLVSNIG